MFQYVNTSEGVGTSVVNIIKGTAQTTASVLDKNLDPSVGVFNIVAVGTILAFAAFVIKIASDSMRMASSAYDDSETDLNAIEGPADNEVKEKIRNYKFNNSYSIGERKRDNKSTGFDEYLNNR